MQMRQPVSQSAKWRWERCGAAFKPLSRGPQYHFPTPPRVSLRFVLARMHVSQFATLAKRKHAAAAEQNRRNNGNIEQHLHCEPGTLP